ncbi:MAG: PAS domain S-box protein [Bacteroidota bacterium]|nr:PAS domain S-box protein [Bacteroidota bacterium]
MLGYSDKNDIINRKILEFAHPDYIEEWQELQTKLWKEKIASFSLDTCLVKKDGTIFCCHVNSILFEDEDRKLGYTIINERKILEEKSNGFTKPANDDVYGNP